MTEVRKRDVSVSMGKASLYATILAIPILILQALSFSLVQGLDAFLPKWNLFPLGILILAGIPIHEFIHGLTWIISGKKTMNAIKFGFMWKTLTPYAHVREPLEVSAYRLGAFMPCLVLGIIPFIVAMVTGSGDLMLFSLVHTSAASGDLLILWLIRQIKPGSLVEDHPARAGCYVLENA